MEPPADCHNLSIDPSLETEIAKMLRFFKAVHMKTCLGYQPRQRGEKYPFPVYLSRHKAAAELENEGALSGNDAHCRSGVQKQS